MVIEMLQLFNRWRGSRAAAWKLGQLDDRALQDIGITRETIHLAVTQGVRR